MGEKYIQAGMEDGGDNQEAEEQLKQNTHSEIPHEIF